MIHHRQRLPLRLEPRDHLLDVHPQFDDLEGDAAFDRFGFLPVIPYTDEMVREHARIWAEAEAAGNMTGYYDLIVAATSPPATGGISSTSGD